MAGVSISLLAIAVCRGYLLMAQMDGNGVCGGQRCSE